MSTKAVPLGLRLFLEGVEVPVISASVSVQPDSPATASIQIIPTDMSLYLLPRTLVHLFYMDSQLTDEELDASRKVADKNAQTRASVTVEECALDRYDLKDFAYKVLFTGEVVGISYRKTPLGRQMVLQCMDLSSYWDCCYQFFSDYAAGGNGLTDKTHHFVGAGEGIFDNIGGHDWVMSRILNSPPKTPEYQECEGLLGGLIHLLETVGGLRYRNKGFHGFRGVNDFFTIAELRYGLLSMLGAIAADKTSSKLFASKAFREWIKNGMTSIGTLVSFRDMLNHINRFIFHNIYPNPCAYYKPGGDVVAKRTVKLASTNYLTDNVGAVTVTDLKRVHTMLTVAIDAMKEIVSRGTDQIILNDPLEVARKNLIDCSKIIEDNAKLVEASKSDNADSIGSQLKSVANLVQTARKSLPGPQNGELVKKVQSALDSTTSASDEVYKLLNKESAHTKPKEAKVPGASFLYNQLFLPEAFFVSPPRCNVIFPEQYYDLNYSRNFLREITRLASHGGLGMLAEGRQGAQLFGRFYIAPNVKDVRGGLTFSSPSQGSNIILPHEVHAGIIPKIEWITDGHRWGYKAAKAHVSKVSYLQRLANFQFYLHRWSARQLTISGLFNPNIVAGLPAVILDRSAPAPAVLERLEKTLRRRMLPTQFVGKIHSYAHNIGQQGGSTSIQFTYARTHRGLDDEFLGVLSREIYGRGSATATFEVNPKALATSIDPAAVQSKSTGKEATAEEKAKVRQQAKADELYQLRTSIVRMWTEKKLKAGIIVPMLGKISKVELVGTSWLNQYATQALGVTTGFFVDNAASFTSDPNNPSSLEGKLVKFPEKILLTYHPMVPTGRYERTGVAFEDIVRPGWFSEDVWSNENITKAVYAPLLGSRAITDDVSLGQAQQDELLKRWKEEKKTIDGSTVDVQKKTTVEKYEMPVVKGSAEESIDGVSLVYGLIKERHGNVHDFIRDFTRRPIASLVDMLGSQNLEFDSKGHVANPDTMIEGFHSRAFGDYNTDVQLPDKEDGTTQPGGKALFALMEGVANPANLKRPGMIDTGAKTGIRPELDPRGRARGRVRAYVEELQLSRGLLGS